MASFHQGWFDDSLDMLPAGDYSTWQQNDFSNLALPIPSGKTASSTTSTSFVTSTTDEATEAADKSKKSPQAKQNKRLMNKLAAVRYRKKKREQLDALSTQSAALKKDNTRLSARCDQLESQVAYMRQLLLDVASVPAPSSPLCKSPCDKNPQAVAAQPHDFTAIFAHMLRTETEKLTQTVSSLQSQVSNMTSS
eukprot:m.143080 g.143080  ORF g.143080 m.143080 type:complete len:194 (-) comp14079_c1_seq1:428-1009(-)